MTKLEQDWPKLKRNERVIMLALCTYGINRPMPCNLLNRVCAMLNELDDDELDQYRDRIVRAHQAGR